MKNHLLNNNWKSGSPKTCSMKSFALVPLWYGFFFLNMFKAFDKPEISSLPEFLKRNVFIHLMEDSIIKSPQNSCWSDPFFSFAALFIIQFLPPALNSCLILISLLRRASLVMCNSARCSFCFGLLPKYNLVSMQSWYVEVFVSEEHLISKILEKSGEQKTIYL